MDHGNPAKGVRPPILEPFTREEMKAILAAALLLVISSYVIASSHGAKSPTNA